MASECKVAIEQDVVIIVDENFARNSSETLLGKDGQVRHAVVRTKNVILKRSVVTLTILNVLDKSMEPNLPEEVLVKDKHQIQQCSVIV